MEKIPFVIRPYQGSDANFILSYLLKSYVVAPLKVANRPHCITRIDRNYIVSYYHEVLMSILVNKPESVTLAVSPEDPNHLLGFSIGEPGALGYVFVKELYRNNGIGKALVEQYMTAGRPRYLAVAFATPAGKLMLDRLGIMHSDMTFSQFNKWSQKVESTDGN